MVLAMFRLDEASFSFTLTKHQKILRFVLKGIWKENRFDFQSTLDFDDLIGSFEKIVGQVGDSERLSQHPPI